ncbi:zinc finger protein Elbow [Armigeres subalbatus]|uniref:zinc finger protein Elbow n=1 Tax=Armigeres subalbatus TaxID=124917 RepID=UPI002ECFF93B
MLTSSNQYIRPEYLSPLPTTFDSKTSPLALLAQTCSAIGSDSPNPKLLANIEKSTKGSRDKLSPGTLSSGSSNDTPKSSFKPYEPSTVNREQTKSPDDTHSTMVRNKSPKRSVNAPNHQILNGRCESNQSAASSRASPTSNHRKTPSSSQLHLERTSSPNRASSKDSLHALMNSSTEATLSKPSTESISKDPSSSGENSIRASTSAPSSTTIGPPYYSGYGSYPIDLLASSALTHHQMLKAAAMNPYFNYSKLKMPGAPDSMIPVCRDPYCTGCALSSHMLGKLGTSSCPAGCTQCDHPGSKTFSQAAAAASLAASQSSAAMYAHAQLAALAAASQLPYVCNWIGSDSSYCGKRFAASEELFQTDLRTQILPPEFRSFTSEFALINPATAAAVGLPPTHPLFQRTYPTPPLSPMSTARYHPYGKPPLLPPAMSPASLAGIPMPPHPSLAQYFPPYSFYGARLNGSNNMHP